MGYALAMTTVEALRHIEGLITWGALMKALYAIRNCDAGTVALTYCPQRHLRASNVQRGVVRADQ
jgi:hypothetical protein